MDLYRLGEGASLTMLGIPQVLRTCVCLVEWPDRLAAATPSERLGE